MVVKRTGENKRDPSPFLSFGCITPSRILAGRPLLIIPSILLLILRLVLRLGKGKGSLACRSQKNAGPETVCYTCEPLRIYTHRYTDREENMDRFMYVCAHACTHTSIYAHEEKSCD